MSGTLLMKMLLLLMKLIEIRNQFHMLIMELIINGLLEHNKLAIILENHSQ